MFVNTGIANSNKKKEKKYQSKHNGQIKKVTNKKQGNKQLHCAYYSRMNFQYFFTLLNQLLGQRRKNKNVDKKKCNTFKAALQSGHRCHEHRREIYTINISNKTVEIAGILFYISTDILVVLLLVKYVPQYIYMKRYDQQELSWERLNILGANEVSSKIARPTLKGVSISINGLLACSNLRNPVLFVNPLSPGINIHILLTVVHIFHMIPFGRICLNIKTFHLW